MMNFYTNIEVWGGKILYRGIKNGRRFRSKVEYHPTLFVPSQKQTEYKSIYGDFFAPVKPGTIKETRDFIKQYDGVENFTIYGNTRYEYCFLADEYPGQINWDISNIKIANIDIEVGSESGFPEPDLANEPLISITIKMDGHFTTFGVGSYDNRRSDLTYIKCASENDLIVKFISWWETEYPDIITGWFVSEFDIPYLVNRIRKVAGENIAKKLSPWNVIRDVSIKINENESKNSYAFLGIATLDMVGLYKRYAKDGKSQESYNLNNISHVELGEKKLSYSEYGNLHTLHKENFQLFIDYNIKDVDLVDKIDQKNKLIMLALTISYDNKCNFEDVFAQTRMWDVIIFHHFKSKKMVFPPLRSHEKKNKYEGAYVKEPIPGYYYDVGSFDATSEYPSVIMGSNISPETIVDASDYTESMHKVLSQNVTIERLLNQQIDTSYLKKDNVTLTANGQFFRRDKQGFMPELIEKMFGDRKRYRNEQIELEKLYEKEESEELYHSIARLENLQLAKKLSLNSLYGAMGSIYFRFYDLRQAVAVTTTGQLSIRWAEKNINAYLNKILKTNEDYIIAIDTDSVYINFNKLVNNVLPKDAPSNERINFLDKVCKSKIQPLIDKSFDELGSYTNVYQQKIFMKREVLCDKAIWTGKKRYILNVYNSEGVAFEKPKVKVKGLEMIKSSTPTSCRDKLKESIDVILYKDEEAIIKFINDFRKEFKTLNLENISIPKGVSEIGKWEGRGTLYGGTERYII